MAAVLPHSPLQFPPLSLALSLSLSLPLSLSLSISSSDASVSAAASMMRLRSAGGRKECHLHSTMTITKCTLFSSPKMANSIQKSRLVESTIILLPALPPRPVLVQYYGMAGEIEGGRRNYGCEYAALRPISKLLSRRLANTQLVCCGGGRSLGRARHTSGRRQMWP